MVFWKLGGLEAWKLGGAPEVEARAAAFGGDETARGADAPRRTENGERRTERASARRIGRCTGDLSVARLRALLHLLISCWGVLLARRRRAGGAGRTSPCRGVGQRPTFQSANLPISQFPFVSFVSFVIFNPFWQSFTLHPSPFTLRAPSWFFVSLRVSPAGQAFHPLPAAPSLALFCVFVESEKRFCLHNELHYAICLNLFTVPV